ncbi:CLIP-associating protein 1-like isoform X2 [Corticium candelabrum]|uniref:CLIP-associating protein 1-like isoform X2 n=1 Tax=Corticium candelabrum TaxID=121492 RepID=UPI002E27661D|nr:CLIP-associating protein 1-like isoform X2 [Corticium candelabrum]
MTEAQSASKSRHRIAGGGVSRTPSSVNRSGAVDESDFEKMFAETPHVTIHSARHLEEDLAEIVTTLENEKAQWEMRVAALKKFRGLVKNGAQEHDEFPHLLREMQEAFRKAVVDLRSQVVREACVAISFAAVSMGLKFDQFAAAVLTALFQVLPNSAKIISSSGHVCITFIVKHVHSHILIPLFTNTVTSRSSVIRRRGAEYISQLLNTWEAKHCDRHPQEIESAISKAIVDSDPGARAAARNAFWSYSDHFKKRADKLLNTLDSGTQKLLLQSRPLSTAVVSTPSRRSVKKSAMPAKSSKLFHASAPDLSEDLGIKATPSRRKGFTNPSSATVTRMTSTTSERRGEMNSERPSGLKVANHSSTLSAHKDSVSSIGTSEQPSPTYHSPTHHLSPTHPRADADSTLSNHIESSPYPVSDSVHQWVTTTRGRTPKHSHGSLTLSHHDTPRSQIRLPSSRAHKSPRTPKTYTYLTKEALDSLTNRVRKDSTNADSDDDAASITSDVSFSSTMSEMTSTRFNLIEDLSEIMSMGRSSLWTDRKDAVMSLHHLLHTPRTFTKPELKSVTELCQKFFVEPHTKVFGLYLDFLCDFVSIHNSELHEWLFVLLLRMLHKLGSEIRGSLLRKLAYTVKVVRGSFVTALQFATVMRIMLDQSQPMNPKTKLAALNFLLELIPVMESQDLQNVPDARLGVTKLITFTSEPKSVAIRRAACCVLIALFDLNTAAFTVLLTQLSKHFRDIATRILQHHTKKESDGQHAASLLSSRAHNEQLASAVKRSQSGELAKVKSGTGELAERQRTSSGDKRHLGQQGSFIGSRIPHLRSQLPTSRSPIHGASPLMPSSLSHTNVQAQRHQVEDEHQVRRKSPSTGSMVNVTKVETEIRRVSDGQQPVVEGIRRGRSPFVEKSVGGAVSNSSEGSEYNPNRYQDSNGLNGQTDSDDVNETEREPAKYSVLIQDLASSDSTSVEKALRSLIELARDEEFEFWEECFSQCVAHIFVHLKSEVPNVRTQALRAFYEVLRSQPMRFTPLTVEATQHCLDASRDSVENISKSVDELLIPLAVAVDPRECANLLTPVVAKEDVPVLPVAVKLLTKVIERLTTDQLVSFLPQIMPGLVAAYSHSASGVRKASVFCMVSVHVAVGEQMAPFLTQLTGSQMKLLNLYIKRAASNTTSPMSQTTR